MVLPRWDPSETLRPRRFRVWPRTRLHRSREVSDHDTHPRTNHHRRRRWPWKVSSSYSTVTQTGPILYSVYRLWVQPIHPDSPRRWCSGRSGLSRSICVHLRNYSNTRFPMVTGKWGRWPRMMSSPHQLGWGVREELEVERSQCELSPTDVKDLLSWTLFSKERLPNKSPSTTFRVLSTDSFSLSLRLFLSFVYVPTHDDPTGVVTSFVSPNESWDPPKIFSCPSVGPSKVLSVPRSVRSLIPLPER